MGPYNLQARADRRKSSRRIDDIGGPDTHTNFPHGWAMASNTPLRRYKQNTHGGGIRDPLVMSLAEADRGARRAAPSVRARLRSRADPARAGRHRGAGRPSPASRSMPIEGESFAAASITTPSAPSKASPQYFEMFGHRGLWHDGWKAVAYHPPGTPFENDKWELFHLDRGFLRDRRSRGERARSGSPR